MLESFFELFVPSNYNESQKYSYRRSAAVCLVTSEINLCQGVSLFEVILEKT